MLTVTISSFLASFVLLLEIQFFVLHICADDVILCLTSVQVLAVFIFVTMVALVYCAQVHSSATYQDVVAACCGGATRNFCSLAIALYSFGTCVTFLIIIGDQWDKCKNVGFTLFAVNQGIGSYVKVSK